MHLGWKLTLSKSLAGRKVAVFCQAGIEIFFWKNCFHFVAKLQLITIILLGMIDAGINVMWPCSHLGEKTDASLYAEGSIKGFCLVVFVAGIIFF